MMTQTISKKVMCSLMAVLVSLAFVIAFVGAVEPVAVNAAVPGIQVQAHVQDKGWLSSVNNGKTAGTTGAALRLECLRVKLTNISGGISIATHQSDVGWTAYKSASSGKWAESGSTGQSRAIEAVKIKLTGQAASQYDIYYRMHIAYFGWLGWAKNNEVAGSTGIAVQSEAIQIKLVKKGTYVSKGGAAYLTKPNLTYYSHVQDIGNMSAVKEGAVSGTEGRALRMEALCVNLKDFNGQSGISVKAHVADIGWMNWVSSGQIAGTTGRSLQMEAVQIKLNGTLASIFDVYYRLHVQDIGWMGWACNGESAGTIGGGLRAEAIQIVLVNKGNAFNKGGTAYKSITSASNNTASANAMSYPLKDAKCSWRGYNSSTWSWSESRTGSSSGRNFHLGLDLTSSTGNKNVYAFSKGTVAACSSSNAGANGRYVIVQHNLNGKTVYSFYAHLSSVSVKNGQSVDTNTVLGVMGGSGYGSDAYYGPHLHFAIVDTLWTGGGYWGYSTYFTGNSLFYSGVTYYNPKYVVENKRLP